MSTVRAWAVVLTAMLLVPTALASGLTARSLVLSGSTTLEGDAAALYFLFDVDGAPVDWSITAASGTLERAFVSEIAADHPANPTSYLVDYETESGAEEIELREATLTSTGGHAQGAFLAQGDLASSATSGGIVSVRSVMDPVVSQFGEREIGGGENYGIEETIPGELLEVTLSDGTVSLRGDLLLELYGPSYTLENEGATTDHQTGEFETSRTGPIAEVTMEKHTIHLVDAVMHVRAREPITVYSRFSTIDVIGTVEASGGEGAVEGTPMADDAGAWSGTTRLSLSSASGLVAAASPGGGSVGTAAILAQPHVPATLGVALTLVAVGVLAFVLLRRKREDDLETALLAMEERRWQDALPPLTRLAKRQPTNAGVMIDRALCLEQVGRFEEAAKAFEAALRAAPRHAEAHFYYARTLAKMHEKEAARVHLEAALERDPRLVEMMRAETVLKGL